MRPSKDGLKDREPHKWWQSVRGLWRRHQHKPEVQKLDQSQLFLAPQLLSDVGATRPYDTFPVTFDHWDTQPAFCRFLDNTLQVPSVGTLAGADLVVLQPEHQRLEAFDTPRQQEPQQALQDGTRPILHTLSIPSKGGQETSYSYGNTPHLHHFGQQRLVINHRQAALSDSAAYFIGHKLPWPAGGLTRLRRHRWPVAVSHEAGKAEGLEQDQVRDCEAIARPIALVAVTYSW
jgi:hypothetical protein